MIQCSNMNCDRGLWFHLECLDEPLDEIPEGDWWCSDNCQQTNSSIFCSCRKVKKGAQIQCSMGPLCENGRWFHKTCVGKVTLKGNFIDNQQLTCHKPTLYY